MSETPAGKPRRIPIQGSGYTPLEMLGVIEPDATTVEAISDERTLRDELVAAGTAAAEQWLSKRANRRMSDVNRRRLAGHVVNALWQQIEQATVEIAGWIAEDDRAARDVATVRAEKAEAALAEMRERHEVQWATRIGDDSDGIPVRYYPDDEWTCRQRAALGYGVPHHLVQRDIYPTPWRDADATPRTALERAADEQGDGEGGGA